MRELPPSCGQAIEEMALRHRFSVDAVLSMLESIIQGKGSVARFDHPEFGGRGQWTRDGVTTTFEVASTLQTRVHALGLDLARLVASEPGLRMPDQESAVREAQIRATIEELTELRTRGILTDEEFAARRAELLARI